MSVKIVSRWEKAMAEVNAILNNNLIALAEDAAKMAKQLMAKEFKVTTGALAASLKVQRDKNFLGIEKVSITTDTQNSTGNGYGMAAEWGYHTKTGKKIKGSHIILRSVKGMQKRFERGERWRD